MLQLCYTFFMKSKSWLKVNAKLGLALILILASLQLSA